LSSVCANFFKKGGNFMDSIYERIEKLCKEKGITVTDLCRECAIPRAILSDYKMGRSKALSTSVLSKIATFFSVSVEYLLEGKNSKAVENQLKVALFGGSDDVTDEMWEEVKRYAKFIYDKEQKS
jgi:transcriptional regulator with XRE-family HTH domain